MLALLIAIEADHRHDHVCIDFQAERTDAGIEVYEHTFCACRESHGCRECRDDARMGTEQYTLVDTEGSLDLLRARVAIFRTWQVRRLTWGVLNASTKEAA
jgi:hypothetical protein